MVRRKDLLYYIDHGEISQDYCPCRKDLENYLDHGEISEDWCPEEVTSAIVTWIRSNIQPDEPIVSIGCGNGTLLLQLVSNFFLNQGQHPFCSINFVL